MSKNHGTSPIPYPHHGVIRDIVKGLWASLYLYNIHLSMKIGDPGIDLPKDTQLIISTTKIIPLSSSFYFFTVPCGILIP